ncbi:MAG: 3-hydroxyisobutyrate dehydrogenase [Parvibaculum sp.]|uniref:3-hydroxyisobutyrate dehydrogenase n=1 Tax=Parvibaculum sp. TaxID=2024848 RepID=UPI001DF1278C|nr:3-hydroxyisobutyrate dehydrogenase [Parvibaculum sp.]MBX3488100.1 3-hydroxyisobutyrate dehydrogenase [Parvibaculum sp.]MBX3496920.1 3-hydroxyisobutyrate dehydrogenase [Parvibaculum sp.]MCW5727922.1 3-hydroxyisobutyrate dehydrogenase [Parvibaculum sp.]
MAKVGFIGLGNMGGPMARNLLKAGHELKVFDLSEKAVAGLVEAGAAKASRASDAARNVEFVVTMLPAGEHVRSVYLGDEGLVAAAAKGTVFIDSSTIDVPSARETIAAAEKAGMQMVDAPVSGGVGGAEAGTLTFMVGGSDEAFGKAKPLLEKMGKNIFHAGAAGNGQVAKVCNNMILGISMIGVSEAFVLGEKLGLDAQTLFDISSTASGQCWSMTSYCPVPGPVPASPANRNYAPGFSAAMMLKDLRLAQDASKTARTPTPLGAQAAQLYALMEAAGEDGLDFSGVIKLIRGEI